MLSQTRMVFPALVLIAQQSVAPSQLVPPGSPIAVIGKRFPNEYMANRSANTLPLVRSLTPKQIKSFSGLVWPERAGAPAEFRNGKRFKADPGNKLNGQTFDTFVKALKPTENPHYSTKQLSGFMVKLPGEEKKLAGFEGNLSGGFNYFLIKGGKVLSSWSGKHHK